MHSEIQPRDVTVAGGRRAGLATTTGRAVAVLAILAVALTAAATLAEFDVADPDLWHHLAWGRETLARGGPPSEDPFAYVPTIKPIVHHEWLTTVVFYWMLQHWGAWSFAALRLVVGLSTLVVAGFSGWRRGASLASILVIVVTILPAIEVGFALIRAQAFTFLLFAIFIFLLEDAHRGRRWPLAVAVALIVPWANLHGGFLAGIGLMMLYALSSAISDRRLAWPMMAATVTAVVASLANPYGIDYWRYLAQAVTMPRPTMADWKAVPLDVWTQPGFKALVLIAGLSAFAVPRRHWPGIVVLGVTAFLGFRHVRHIPFFAIAALAYLAPMLTPLLARALRLGGDLTTGRQLLTRGLGTAAIGFLAIASAHQLARFTSWTPTVPASFYPVGSVDFIRLNGLSGNLATPFNWGSFVTWKLSPDVKVSIDGRFEVAYPEEVRVRNLQLLYGVGNWQSVLEDYPTDMILVDRAYPMAALVRTAQGWTRVYGDALSEVYVRSAKSNRAWLMPAKRDAGTFP